MKKVSVIIPTYNRKETLKETLLSFADQTSKDFEIIIADDGSTDGTREMVGSLNVPYPLVYVWQKNSGRSAARNMGIGAAKGKIVLFVDDHIVVDKKFIEEHIKSHELYAKDNVKVVRGRVEFYDSIDKVPKSTSYTPEVQIRSPRDEQDPFRNFITNNISIDREALIRIGGFDEDFKEYGLQDSECGLRLREAGYKFKVNPNAVGYIFGVGLTFEMRCSRRRQVGRSSVLFFRKHPTLKVKLTLSTHWLALLLYRVFSLLKSRVTSQKALLFCSFLTGIKEGFEKYKKPMKLASRFRRKKILLLSHNSRLEGAPISLYLLASTLDKNKYDPIFVTPLFGPLNGLLKRNAVKTKAFFGPKFIWPYLIKGIINKEGVDIAHINTLETIWAIDTINERGIPIVWHIREDNNHPAFHRVKEMMGKISRVIAISRWVKAAFSLPENKVRVVYNGVDLSAFSLNVSGNGIRKELKIQERERVVGQIGSISERKGCDTFLKSAAKVADQKKDVKFMLVGDYIPGEFFKSKFRRLAKELNIKSLILTGVRSDIPQIIAGMDIVVSASISEPFGRTLVEGMAMGKAVIGTNVGGIPEIIVNGKTGLIIPPNDPNALSEAMLKLLEDGNLRARMGEEGRRRVEELFTIEKHARQVEKIYEEVLNETVGHNPGL